MVDKPKEKENATLREDKINKLFNAFDECLDTAIHDDMMNFLEIEISIKMMQKKLNFEQSKSWMDYINDNTEGYDPPETKPPGGMFG